ncbi:MAG: glycogen-binding domain-containing protein [Kiritimatiellaeota bacterium]|nr:glycogen-binding domain-containing protein [Kiritimatiellota bacterium]
MPGKTKTEKTKAAKPANKITPATRKRVTFKHQTKPGSSVSVAGSFNNWDTASHPLKDKEGSGLYTLTLLLAPGIHEYKFMVDGVWCVDPGCAEWVQNNLGTLNSLLRV